MAGRKKDKMKIKISKSQWNKIGLIAGWIKIAKEGDIEQIGDKWYKETNGDIVEIENPNKAKSMKLTIKGEDIVFTEGEKYKNYFGEYIIRSINNDNTITVEYTEGNLKGATKTYPAKSQAETIINEKQRQQINNANNPQNYRLSLSSDKEFFTLGYLAKHGKVIAEVPEDKALEFEKIYNQITGDNASKKYLIVPKKENRWFIKLRLKFNLPDNPQLVSQLSFPNDVNVINKQGVIEINNNGYIYGLFRSGFKLGNNSNNYSNMSSGLSGNSKTAFDSGFNS